MIHERLSFGWHETYSLATELERPILRLSVSKIFPESRPSSITLWHADNAGITIYSKMHDLADRIEVGVLQFEKATAPHKEEFFACPFEEPSGNLGVSKLILEESGFLAESGLLLTASSGKEILIVAAEWPLHLVIQGAFSEAFVPEYPIERYSRERYA